MEIIVNKVNLKEQTSDFGYWQKQSHEARLEALEQIRHEYHKWKGINAGSGLQRVYTIVKR